MMIFRSVVSFVSLMVLLLLNGQPWAFDIPEAKITIKVVDEAGTPVGNAEVKVGFELPRKGEQGIDNKVLKGSTDANGLYSVTNPTIGDVGFEINKKGYYDSYGEYKFTKSAGGHWEPRGKEVIMVLRTIKNPVPMYARNSIMSKPLILPVSDSGIGFDLTKYDWVAPYGIGATSDLIFRLENEYRGQQNFDAKLFITFSNSLDGIHLVKDDRKFGSKLKLPRYAPDYGYLDRLTASITIRPTVLVSSFKKDINYIFRIRSEEKDGKLERAMYGKIHGDIQFWPTGAKSAVIKFKYYLNPDYTKNLEFDPERNLFLNLKSTERVGLQ